jgi:hypothetical protein
LHHHSHHHTARSTIRKRREGKGENGRKEGRRTGFWSGNGGCLECRSVGLLMAASFCRALPVEWVKEERESSTRQREITAKKKNTHTHVKREIPTQTVLVGLGKRSNCLFIIQ